MSEGRITQERSFLDLVDTLGRGSTEEWQRLFQAAQQDADLRERIQRALPLVDPEMGAGGEIWNYLLISIAEGHAPVDWAQEMRRVPAPAASRSARR